jgi:predicted phage terminase large subunit-like protein
VGRPIVPLAPARRRDVELRLPRYGAGHLPLSGLKNVSAEYTYVGYDELTQFTEDQYLYLFSRLRKPDSGMPMPLRMRATSNPGGVGHDWVKARFIDNGGRAFIPAKLEHNPHLDRPSYEAQLNRLDPVTRAQLRAGDWNIRPAGNLFRPEWFAERFLDNLPPLRRTVRFWDLAATEEGAGKDPDYTAGVKVGETEAREFVVLDAQEFRASPADTERKVKTAAQADGTGVEVHIEQEPGASGKSLIAHYQRDVLPGFAVYGVRSSGDKLTRFKPFSAACQNGLVWLPRGAAWVGHWLNRLAGFGLPGVHDDTGDSSAGAHRALTQDAPWTPDGLRQAFPDDGSRGAEREFSEERGDGGGERQTVREQLLARVRGTQEDWRR